MVLEGVGRRRTPTHALSSRELLARMPARMPARQGPPVRQSHILFLQPDRGTIVRPLAFFRRGDGQDREAVRRALCLGAGVASRGAA